MTQAIDIFICGEPAPGGSKTAIPLRDRLGGLILKYGFSKRFQRNVPMPVLKYVDDSKNVYKWRKAAVESARAQFRGMPLDCPLRVLFRFQVRRPQYHYEGDDRKRPLRPEYFDAYPVGPPDVLKYTRATEDALTGIVWVDDSRICQEYLEKRFAEAHEPEGCRVLVTKCIPDHAPEGLFAEGVSA